MPVRAAKSVRRAIVFYFSVMILVKVLVYHVKHIATSNAG